MHRSLRRRGQLLRGQLLVVVGALLGALIGVALGLAVEDPQTSMAVAASGRVRGSALAVSPPSSQPQASRAASSDDRANGNDSAGGQRAESADRPGKRHGNAHKHSEGGRDKPGKGKDR